MSYLNKWYRGLKLPNWGSALVDFLSPSAGLLSTLLPVSVPIRFSDEEITACADRTNNLIILGTNFLSARVSERLNPLATKEEAVTFALGCCVHEGCHFAWSPNTIPDLLNPGVPHNKTTGFIANLVEDIYIEDRLIREYPNLAWMILGAWDYMFDLRTYKGLDKWDGLSLTSASVADILSTACYWKHQSRHIPTRSVDEQMLQDMFYSVRGMNDLADRKNLVQKIVELFLYDAEVKEDAPVEIEGKGATSDGQLVRADKVGNRRYENAPQVIGGNKIESVDAIGKSKVFSVVAGSCSTQVVFDKRWTRFAEIAKQRGAVRNIVGPPTLNAKRLTHPVNIATSGKVFSKNTLTSTHGNIGAAKPEILILVDLSNSMLGRNKYQNALHATYGAMKGMGEAGMSFAVYGYTTETSENATLMVKIKGFNEPFAVGLKRCSHLINHPFLCQRTPDIVALQFAAKQFLPNGSDRAIIVITDGEPSFDKKGLSSDMRVPDAKDNVDAIRGTGVKVFGLSIDPTADYAVKRIYGDDALFSSDPNAIDKFLARFI